MVLFVIIRIRSRLIRRGSFSSPGAHGAHHARPFSIEQVHSAVWLEGHSLHCKLYSYQTLPRRLVSVMVLVLPFGSASYFWPHCVCRMMDGVLKVKIVK